MGIFKAKCPNCWDSIPCNCSAQKERDQAAESSRYSCESSRAENQIELLKELLKEIRLLRKEIKNGKQNKSTKMSSLRRRGH